MVADMSFSRYWIVKSETTGKIFGPFPNAHSAGKWATRFMAYAHQWVIIRLRKP